MQTDRFVEKTISSVQPGDHLCCIYEDEQQHRETLTRFIGDGLAQGHQVVYYHSAHDPGTILGYLRGSGVAYEAALASGQLVLASALDSIADDLSHLVETSRAAGYPALRWTGEMAWANPDSGASDGLMAYEARVNALAAAQPVIILCQYHRARFSPAVLLDVLLTHPRVVVGQHIYDNFYYLPPDALQRQDQAAARLDGWLNNLTHRQQMEWRLEQARSDLAHRVEEQLANLANANERLYQEIRSRLGMEFALLQANEALRETEDRYKTIFDASSDAIFILDLAGRFIEMNQVACERFEYPREELLGMRPEQLVVEAYRDKVAERMQLLTQDGAITFETIHLTRSRKQFPAEVNARRIKYEDGWAILSIAHDITERKQTEQILRESEAHARESEAKFRSLIENSPDGITLIDENARIVEYNPGCERIFGIPASQALGRSPTDIYFATLPDKSKATPELYAWSEARLAQVCRAGEAEWLGQLREYEILRPDGGRRVIQSASFAIPTGRGFMMGTIDRDVTGLHQTERELEQYRQRLEMMVAQRTTELRHEVRERQQVQAELIKTNQALAIANAELRESEQRYRALITQSPVAIMVVQDDCYRYANPVAARILGYDAAEMVGMTVADTFSPQSRRLTMLDPLPEMGAGQAEPVILHFTEHAGGSLYVEYTSAPIVYEGRPAYLVISQDVTDRIHYEQQLEASLAEKEVMLREIHHRVKNNLNVIIALIDLQKANQADPQVLQVFKELQSRAYTMSLVHESLYRSPNLANIDFPGYLRTLVEHLRSAYGPGLGDPFNRPVAVHVQADDVALKIEAAIPCGLIVNELVTNALKYAFPAGSTCRAGDECEIVVKMEHLGADELALSVRDNGVGLPAGLDWRSASTLGLQLIQVLARQLGGTIALDGTPGVAWTLTFTERR